MSDDFLNNDSNDEDSQLSASAIFTEMMRQVAARQSPEDAPDVSSPISPSPPSESEASVSIPSVDDSLSAITYIYIILFTP